MDSLTPLQIVLLTWACAVLSITLAALAHQRGGGPGA